MRQGVAEVIYGEGKTPEQIFRIAEAMKEKGQKAVLITRMNKESAIYVGERLELQYDEVSRIGFIGEVPIKDGDGKIVVATGWDKCISLLRKRLQEQQRHLEMKWSVYMM